MYPLITYLLTGVTFAYASTERLVTTSREEELPLGSFTLTAEKTSVYIWGVLYTVGFSEFFMSPEEW